ncbi:unnamed protein product [Meloidogyne enterolobii]|uniref:Uncharacterized protein n=1 Tax=Meloidogyne enterolobii TaxID=390850 RepID=A0ACB1AHY7_MELEN
MQTFFLLALLYYRKKKITGICASAAQIAGSFVCPYLIYKAISRKFIDFIPFAPVAFTWWVLAFKN